MGSRLVNDAEETLGGIADLLRPKNMRQETIL